MKNLYYLLTRTYGLLYNRWRHQRYTLIPIRYFIKRVANIILPKYLDNNKCIDVNCLKSDRRIIVSLTSFPKRINNVWKVIECMRHQTMLPDKILLWLSKEQFKSIQDVPVSLLSKQSEMFEIRLVEGDLRSHKKYYYAFNEFSNDYVVTIDDDIYYPPYMIEQLINGRKEHPDSVIGRYCLIIKYDEKNGMMPYNEWDVDYEIGQKDAFFGSGGGTLFVPSELYKDVTNYHLAVSLAPLADDVWLNAMARLANRSVWIVSKELLLPILTKNDERLTQINVYDNRNDEQIHSVIDYYVKNNHVDPFKKVVRDN